MQHMRHHIAVAGNRKPATTKMGRTLHTLYEQSDSEYVGSGWVVEVFVGDPYMERVFSNVYGAFGTGAWPQ